MTPESIFQNTFILRRPWAAIFADIIKIITMFIKKIFRVSGKVKKNYKLCVKMESIPVFLGIANFS